MEWNNGPFGINVEMSRITRETNAPWPDSEILFFLAQNNFQEENMIWPLDQWSYGDHLSKFNKRPSKIGGYDKRAISKTTLPTTPELFIGLIQAIWQKN